MKYIFLLLLNFSVIVNSLPAQQVRTVYFGFNQSTITSQKLDSLKAWAIQHTLSGTIIIKGHTDVIGSNRYNRTLSERRAKAVATALRSFCDSCNFQIESLGESTPASAINQSLNRRVEITWTSTAQAIDTIQRTISTRPKDTISATGKLLEIPALQRIYFVPDKAVIEVSSQSYIEELANILRHYPANALFEIRGHTNAPGRKFEKLSEDRAREIYLHLIDLGVPASQLHYRGMGNRQMLFPHPYNETEMRKNIRVDVVVFQ